MNIGKNIRERRKELKLSQDDLAFAIGANRVTISKYENGVYLPSVPALERLADALKTTPAALSGSDLSDPRLAPMVRSAVPILGSIACGEPITADENVDGFADLPEGVRADFALRCVGESMVPTFLEGDLVLIRQQNDVADGQIAAVLLMDSNEATLKRVHHLPGGVMLNPDNLEKFTPRVLLESEAANVRILGLAVGFVRMIA